MGIYGKSVFMPADGRQRRREWHDKDKQGRV
jgi:hypothetical protein